MKFEDALAQLRLGKKITHPYFDTDVHFEACYITLKFSDETSEDAKNRGMSIVKMKGDRQHPDMGTGGSLEYIPREFCKHGNMPQIELLLLMSDDWEVLE